MQKISRCELLLTNKKLDGALRLKLESSLKELTKKKKKEYSGLMTKLNRELEEEVMQLLDVVYDKYKDNLKSLSTIKKTTSKDVLDII